ncbi:DUF5590 domain-containing protein [Ornithinibacillus bavariensis]|uniref:DUF5590 domain-containing protein n=1 Tax=Ornithinibacillus bavariensis TaxID=545502 RepID=UPI000EC89D64|nr:hypothetical protein [Ornithinibacillus sp.]
MARKQLFMNKRSFELPSVVKWILLILLILFLAVIIFLIVLYNQIQDGKTAGFQVAEQRVIQESSIIDILKTSRFFGESGYHVIYGKTDDKVTQIAFVPDDKEQKITIVNEDETISSDEVMQNWQQGCKNCSLIKIVPAILKDTPLWEISYQDEANRYVLEYVSIYDGSQYEEFRFKKMFQ